MNEPKPNVRGNGATLASIPDASPGTAAPHESPGEAGVFPSRIKMRLRFTMARPLFALLLLLLAEQAPWAAEANPALTPASALAPASAPALEGIWKWTFTMPDGGQVKPRLRLRREAGKLTGTTRFRAGNEESITNLMVQGNEVSFQIVRWGEGQETLTRYAGTLDGDTLKGKIVSNWSGKDQSYDWEARRLADAEGTWSWTNHFREFTVVSTLKLKQEHETITGKIKARRVNEIEIKKGKFKEGEISFETERERDGEIFVSRYYGKLSGDKILGTMELNFAGSPQTNKWEAIRVD